MKVVIVGGGFAGVNLAMNLNNRENIEILLIDRFNHHQFQPLFYQVATASIDASNISFPFRKAFQKSKNFRFRLADLHSVHPDENLINTSIGRFHYDVLVIATGCTTNFFGNHQMENFSFPMKSTVEALNLRDRFFQLLEDALCYKNDEYEYRKRLSVVVVGGGATGVEVSGALADMRRHILPKDYPDLDLDKMTIYLLEGQGKLLGAMSEKSSADSKHYLEKIGVDIRLNTIVKSYDGEVVTLNNGDEIPAKIVIWAAGITGNLPAGFNEALVVRGNRIKVDRFNKVLNTQNIYAIGDIAYMETPKYPRGHPQVANVAKNQGKLLAKNLLRQLSNKPLKPYEYDDQGSMATVGRGLAVVDLPNKWHFNGAFAWFAWMTVHLFLLLGIKNRVQVFVNWIYKYFTYDQNLRLIFKDLRKDALQENEVK